jgi:hypothetical protein
MLKVTKRPDFIDAPAMPPTLPSTGPAAMRIEQPDLHHHGSANGGVRCQPTIR